MKSTDRILIQRYARAFDRASQTTEQALAAYKQLCVAVQQLAQAHAYMEDPSVSYTEKIKWVYELFPQEESITRFIAVLLEAKRYYLLDGCVQEVSNLLDKRQGILRATVQTAFELTPQAQQKVQAGLSAFSGKTVKAQFSVCSEVLGGLRVYMDGILMDGTFQGQLQKLQQELIK